MVVAHTRPGLRMAWRGPSLVLLDSEGRAEPGRAGASPLLGYYFRETRHLSALALLIDGEVPFPCSVAEVAPHALELSQIYPPVAPGTAGGSGSGASGRRHGLLYRTLDLDLRVQVGVAALAVTLRVTNRWDERTEFDVAWVLAADYAGLLEAQGGPRQQEAPVQTEPMPDGVRFRYQHPALPLETHVRAESAEGVGWTFADGRLSARLALARQQCAELRLVVEPRDAEAPIDADDAERRAQRLAEWSDSVTRLFAPGETPLVELTNTATAELGAMALLDGAEDEWLTPTAGLPLYPAVWARDALTAGWQAAVLDRGQLLEAALNRVARLQGTRDDAWRDEQPGRIIQQARRDPVSRLGQVPFARYYGDVASPFLFVIGLGQQYAWSGDAALVRRHWDAARRVLDWAREYGDRDGDGYIEYLTRSPDGPKHQGWRDSDNAMVHADGTQVEPPIVSAEIQGYHYAALQFMAVLATVLGTDGDARAWWAQAKELKARFNRDLWLDDESCVALGLDARKRVIRTLTANAGQCLTTGIVDDAHVPRLVRRLFQPDLFSGWGIRTLSTGNPAYNPLDYHLGTVWAVENGTTLFGLRRYGYDDRAVELARALYDLARLWEGGRVPECVGGYPRWGEGARAHPGAYPRANAPQAWNRSAFAILVQTLLGIRAAAVLDLLAVDPVLPPWLPELTVRRLRVGGATVSMRFWRDGAGDSHHEVLEQSGTLHIVRQPPLDALTVGVWDRLGALAQGLREG